MMKTKVLVLALSLNSALAWAAGADPGATAMLHKLKQLYPATAFSSVTATPIKNVYEVVMGQNVAYVGGDGRHFLFGRLFDMREQRDLTAAKLGKLETPAAAADPARQIDFASLPLGDAIKAVRGDGSRVLAVFSDPKCPYCVALERELAKLENVTVYTFLLAWISPESRPAAEAAWRAAMPDRADEVAVLDRNGQLATRLGLRGTPMLVAGDGRIVDGARSAAELDAWLASGNSRTLSRAPATNGG